MDSDQEMPPWVQDWIANPRFPLPEQMQGLDLTGEWAWSIGVPADTLACILDLPDLLGPKCVLCIEGVRVSEETQTFFDRHRIHDPIRIARDTMWPISQIWQIPLTRAIVTDYVTIYRKHAEGLPEGAWISVGDHLKAYRDGVLLLRWHDTFSRGGLLVSHTVPEAAIRAFCCGLNVAYSTEPLSTPGL